MGRSSELMSRHSSPLTVRFDGHLGEEVVPKPAKSRAGLSGFGRFLARDRALRKWSFGRLFRRALEHFVQFIYQRYEFLAIRFLAHGLAKSFDLIAKTHLFRIQMTGVVRR